MLQDGYYVAMLLSCSGMLVNTFSIMVETNEETRKICPSSFLWNTLIVSIVIHLYKMVTVNSKIRRSTIADILDIIVCVSVVVIIGLQLSKSCDQTVLKTCTYPVSVYNAASISMYALLSLKNCLENIFGINSKPPLTYFPPAINENTPLNKSKIPMVFTNIGQQNLPCSPKYKLTSIKDVEEIDI